MAGVAAAVSSALPAVATPVVINSALIGRDKDFYYVAIHPDIAKDIELIFAQSYKGKLPFEFGSVDCPVRFIKCS